MATLAKPFTPTSNIKSSTTPNMTSIGKTGRIVYLLDTEEDEEEDEAEEQTSHSNQHDKPMKQTERKVKPPKIRYDQPKPISREADTLSRFDIILTPNRRRDQSVQLELDLIEDINPEPELISTCRRLGLYTDAVALYQDLLLQPGISNTLAFVHYAHTLLEKEDYLAIISLHAPPILETWQQLEWDLIQFVAQFRSEAKSRVAYEFLRSSISTYQSLDGLGDEDWPSAQIRIIVLILDLAVQVWWCSQSPYPEDTPSFWHIWGEDELRHLADGLIERGQVWDYRDLIQVWALASDRDSTRDAESLAEYLLSRFEYWSMGEYDREKSLALLDCLVALILAPGYASTTGNREQFDDLVTYSDRLAKSITENDPGSIRTRPYLRWILAKVTLAQIDILGSHFDDKPGYVCLTRDLSSLPVYGPHNTENPGWRTKIEPERAIKSVQAVLKVAERQGDFGTQAMCLKLLVQLSSNPRALFDELAGFQRSVQGDQIGYLETRLSSFLISVDEKSRSDLLMHLEDFARRLEGLEQTEPRTSAHKLCHSPLLSARRDIERILKYRSCGRESDSSD